MEQVLLDLGITDEGQYNEDNEYEIYLTSDDDFARIYSKLDKSNLDEDDSSASLTEDDASFRYYSDNYEITLVANFLENIYKLIVREV